jgi:hypothetical protein
MRNHWRLLHREESIPRKYEFLCFVLNNIKDKINCDCQPSANQLLLDMLNYNNFFYSPFKLDFVIRVNLKWIILIVMAAPIEKILKIQ